jgi:hypothetical protein
VRVRRRRRHNLRRKLRRECGAPDPREETVILGEPRGPKTELRLSPQQTIDEVESSGLKLAKLMEIPPYHYGAVFEQPLEA